MFSLTRCRGVGIFKAEGLDAQVELITPATKAISALREGATDAYAGGSVHAVLKSFPRWKGVKLIAALSQGIPWLLVVRAHLRAERGDMNALKGLRIGADQEPDAALKQLLIASGLDAEVLVAAGVKPASAVHWVTTHREDYRGCSLGA